MHIVVYRAAFVIQKIGAYTVSVILRLSRHGQPQHPFYRIVAANKQRCRDGKFLEVIGTYNPMVEPPALALAEDKVKKWVGNGAVPSTVVRDLIRKAVPGYLEAREKNALEKLRGARKARKARVAKGGTSKKAKAKK